MNYFHSFPESVRVAFSILTVLCAGAAALAFILHQYRFRRGFAYLLNGAVLFLEICRAIINVALIAQAQHNMIDGIIAQNWLPIHRYILFAALAAAAISAFAAHASCPWQPLAASILTLPIMEAWMGAAFPFLFAAALLFSLVSGIATVIIIHRELSTSISGLSIKQAMDSLNTAVLFYKPNGHILMQNNKMQELMHKTAGRAISNGKLYFETVVAPSAEHMDHAENADFDGHKAAGSYLVRLADGAWLFSAKEMELNGNPIVRLTAGEVTAQDRYNMLLKEKHIELVKREAQLKDFVENIEAISRSEELLRIKTETHDSIGQKLTLLLRYLHQGELPDEKLLSFIMEDFRNDLRNTGDLPIDPQAELDALVSSYGYAKIAIDISGVLPADKSISAVLVKVLREAAANAVIHGYADRLYVDFPADDDSGAVIMRITDNSPLPVHEINEGGGIKGMRQRLEQIGGTLHITPFPRFTLMAAVTSEKDI